MNLEKGWGLGTFEALADSIDALVLGHAHVGVARLHACARREVAVDGYRVLLRHHRSAASPLPFPRAAKQGETARVLVPAYQSTGVLFFLVSLNETKPNQQIWFGLI